jgi:spore coat protein CotH
LPKRFLATPAFRTLYTERYRILYDRIYGRDLLAPKIRELTALVTAYNASRGIVDQAAYNAAASKVLDFVAQRNEYLKSTDLLRP